MCDHCLTLAATWQAAEKLEPPFDIENEQQHDMRGVHLAAKLMLIMDENKHASNREIADRLSPLMEHEAEEVLLDCLQFVARVRAACTTVGDLMVTTLQMQGSKPALSTASFAAKSMVEPPPPDVTIMQVPDGVSEALAKFLTQAKRKPRRKPQSDA